MADLEVFFLHPTTEARSRARVDDSMTAKDVIEDLLRESYMPNHRNGYSLSIKGGAEIQPQETLRSAGVRNSTVLRLLPNTEAGELRLARR